MKILLISLLALGSISSFAISKQGFQDVHDEFQKGKQFLENELPMELKCAVSYHSEVKDKDWQIEDLRKNNVLLSDKWEYKFAIFRAPYNALNRLMSRSVYGDSHFAPVDYDNLILVKNKGSFGYHTDEYSLNKLFFSFRRIGNIFYIQASSSMFLLYLDNLGSKDKIINPNRSSENIAVYSYYRCEKI